MDHWIDDSHFHWQSQNATDPSSKRGQEIIRHAALVVMHKSGRIGCEATIKR
jgi:hypothetical protein